MLIRKCDVCGREINSNEVFYEVREVVPYYIPQTKSEVCIHCAKRIMKKEEDDVHNQRTETEDLS